VGARARGGGTALSRRAAHPFLRRLSGRQRWSGGLANDLTRHVAGDTARGVAGGRSWRADGQREAKGGPMRGEKIVFERREVQCQRAPGCDAVAMAHAKGCATDSLLPPPLVASPMPRGTSYAPLGWPLGGTDDDPDAISRESTTPHLGTPIASPAW
jgi:hypothetical protein